MLRVLATTAGVVNVMCMFLALLTHDVPVLMFGLWGAGFSFYGLIYFTDELRERGQHRMGYLNLAMRIRYDMKEQGLIAGNRLPTVAQLATTHDTTRATVMRALKILASEGLVEVVRGRGTYVIGEGGLRGARTDRPKDRIETHLLKRVEHAEPGEEMPTTTELMFMYGASHVTVRRVQSSLAQRGVLRRTRWGSYVKP